MENPGERHKEKKKEKGEVACQGDISVLDSILNAYYTLVDGLEALNLHPKALHSVIADLIGIMPTSHASQTRS